VNVFLDTSAFAKRYVAEAGSEQVSALCQQATSLVVSVICFPELISTLSRLVREKKLSKLDYRRLKREVIGDLQDVDICQITPAVLEAVIPLLEAHWLRAMDGLHVGCALVVGPDLFVSADHRQLAAAKKAGLKVVNVS
jgi:predicted nucleic acid-binding protein